MPEYKQNYLHQIVEIRIGVRPCSRVATYQVTSMPVLVEIEVEVILLRDLLVRHSNRHPFQIIRVYLEPKCLYLVAESQRWIHQGHLINGIDVCSNCKGINKINIGVFHLV
jgi:hypothetical protein